MEGGLMTEETEHQHAEDVRVINTTPSLDGAVTLSEAASMAHGYAAELKRLHDEGFLLRAPIEDGQAVAYKPEGENQNILGVHDHDHDHEPGDTTPRAYDGII
jgi:hypothetical protein